MKFNDDITMSIASTVKDVLEGKAPKEVKEMDPKKHVSKNGNKFDVVNNKGKVVKSFDNEDAANKYATDNHDDLMKEGPDQPNKPSGKLGQDSGERDFKGKHAIKKVGVKADLDGTVITKEETDLEEAKIDVDYVGDNALSKKLEKKFKVKIKNTGKTTADVSGTNANLIKFLKSDAYLMDNEDIKDLFPELMESTDLTEEVDEESERQEKYKKVFNAALKKFGVKGIGELEGDKKKEFFDYIDKNYDAKDEEVEESVEEVKEGKIKVTAFTGNDPDTMEGESYKKYGLKLKKVGSSYGYDDVELSGPDSKLIKFAQRNLGVSGKNIKAIQKELDNM